jgi:hypothetical protein
MGLAVAAAGRSGEAEGGNAVSDETKVTIQLLLAWAVVMALAIWWISTIPVLPVAAIGHP